MNWLLWELSLSLKLLSGCLINMNELEHAKVTVLGDANSGKSSIILRYVSNNFSGHSTPTIGATFMSKVIDFDKKSIKLSIWDTAGQERYHSLASTYARESRACILVYDITNRESFLNLEKWYNSIIEVVPEDASFFVVGNKEDIVENEDVSLEEAKDFTFSIKGTYMRTSAKLDQGIKELFTEISKKIMRISELNLKESIRSTRTVSVNLSTHKTQKKKSCC